MPRTFEVEQRRGVIGILKDVGRGLIDRDGTGTRDGIGALSGVEAQKMMEERAVTDDGSNVL
jgi:hypothetical protein